MKITECPDRKQIITTNDMFASKNQKVFAFSENDVEGRFVPQRGQVEEEWGCWAMMHIPNLLYG